MSQTLLQIVQTAADRIGIQRPTSVIGSSNQQVRELLTYATQEGNELMKAVPWQELTKEYTFTTVQADAQGANSLPSDWNRVLNDSMYNRTLSRKINGPITAQEWQLRKAFITASSIDYWFRIRGGQILMTPQPSAGNSIYYEYITNQYVLDTDGTTTKQGFTADTDTVRFTGDDSNGDELMALGIRWRFLKAKGLEWETPYNEYLTQRNQTAASQDAAPTLSAGSRNLSAFRFPNVPETGYGP